MQRFRFLCFLVITIGRVCAAAADTATHNNPFLPSATESETDSTSLDPGWPSIRGPHGDGTSDEIHLADSWPESGPPILWVKELGQGYSSLVAGDDRVYTQYQTLAGQYVLCMDAATGNTLWQYRYDWPFESAGMYPGPRSTPTLDSGRVYFATPAGSVACLTSNGKLVWQQNLKETYDGKGTDFGYACSPTIIDGKVIMPVGGYGASMVALDARDGSLIWKSGDAAASYTPAMPVKVDEQWMIIGYLQNSLAAFDLKTGKILWETGLSAGYDEHSAWPIYRAPHLWIAAPFHSGSQLFQLSGGESPSVKRLIQSDTMSNDVSSSVLLDDHVYGFDVREAQSKAHRPSRGSFRCVEFLTGNETWSNGDPKQRRDPSDPTVIGHASVTVADGKLILLNDTGDLILARADPQRCELLARATVLGGEISWSAPALHRGRIFVRNHRRVVCVYVGQPERLESAAKKLAINAREIPQGSVRDLSALLGIEPEYAMDPPTQVWLWNWYLVSLGILVAAFVLALLSGLLSVWFARRSGAWFARRSGQEVTASKLASRMLIIYWLAAYTLGLVTGLPASLATGDFVFTWHVCLCIAFEACVYNTTLRRNRPSKEPIAEGFWKQQPSRRASWLTAAVFVVTCIGYFMLCRRLSLVTQWMFLCGFVAAIPITLLARYQATRGQRHYRHWVTSILLSLVAFTMHYALSVYLLHQKYEIARF